MEVAVSKRILVVDDDWRVADLLEAVFEDMGFVVKQALKPSDAIQLMNNNSFSLVMVDVTLGDQDGSSLACNLKKKGHNVVLFTAKDDYWINQNIPQDIPILKKPFRIEELCKLLKWYNIDHDSASFEVSPEVI